MHGSPQLSYNFNHIYMHDAELLMLNCSTKCGGLRVCNLLMLNKQQCTCLGFRSFSMSVRPDYCNRRFCTSSIVNCPSSPAELYESSTHNWHVIVLFIIDVGPLASMSQSETAYYLMFLMVSIQHLSILLIDSQNGVKMHGRQVLISPHVSYFCLIWLFHEIIFNTFTAGHDTPIITEIIFIDL